MMSADELAARLDENRWRRQMSEATQAAREWAEHFLNGGARSEQPGLDERRGMLLSLLAPSRLRRRPDPDPHRSTSDVIGE